MILNHFSSSFVETNMKFILFAVAFFIANIVVDALDCPDILWGCKRKVHSRHQVRSKVKLRVQRHDNENTVPCLTDDSECREKIQELWKLERKRLNDESDAKRQVDCPFGVWGCKRRIVSEENSKRSGKDRENDLINEIFEQY